MHKLFYPISLMFIVLNCYAETSGFQSTVLTESINNKFSEEVNTIIKKIASIDPEFDTTISSLPTEQQLQNIKTYLSNKLFSYYKDKYTKMLNEQSTSTGRKIKVSKNGNEEIKWLDRGELDSEQCYNTTKGYACDYPYGFIDFEIVYRNNTSVKTLSVSYDVPENNKHYDIDIAVTTDKNTASFTIYTQDLNYDEWQKWRNQEMADIRAGKYIKNVSSDSIEELNTNSRTLRLVTDDRKDWLSNQLPDVHIKGFSIDIEQNKKLSIN